MSAFPLFWPTKYSSRRMVSQMEVMAGTLSRVILPTINRPKAATHRIPPTHTPKNQVQHRVIAITITLLGIPTWTGQPPLRVIRVSSELDRPLLGHAVCSPSRFVGDISSCRDPHAYHSLIAEGSFHRKTPRLAKTNGGGLDAYR